MKRYSLYRDPRDPFWAGMEREIQAKAKKKDHSFRLTGKWKKYTRKQAGFRVYIVDGEWIRRNLSVVYGCGGHGFVHEFIPHDEIWVSSTHYRCSKWNECGCQDMNGRIIKDGRKVSRAYFDSTALHEITEYQEMKKGKPYWRAHLIALEREREVGFLKDPFTEVY